MGLQRDIEMKKVIFAIFTLALLLIMIVGAKKYKMVPEEAEKYVYAQKGHLDSLAKKQVDSLFIHGHTDIFPIYTKCKSRYVKDNFWSQTGTMFRKELWDWNHENRLPEDVVSTYHVAPENEFGFYQDGIVEGIKIELRLYNVDNDGKEIGIQNLNRKGIWQSRWALGVNENWGSGNIVQYIIIPYAVSFRKQCYGSAESFISVDDALDYAFDFYTGNEKSNLKRNMVTDLARFSNGPIIKNDYYTLSVDSDATFVPTTITDSPAYDHCMYNDYFYVFVRAYGQKMYKLTLQEEHVKYVKDKYVKEKREQTYTDFIIYFILIFVVWSILLIWIIWDVRQRKLTILQRIIIKCDPQKFIKKYNGEKLKSANEIYSKAIATKEIDQTVIAELASRAENELGIFIISKKDIKELKELCNPKRFMKPYDAQKVARANELYCKLSQGVVSYSAFAKIKEEISLLYEKNKENSTYLATEDNSSVME